MKGLRVQVYIERFTSFSPRNRLLKLIYVSKKYSVYWKLKLEFLNRVGCNWQKYLDTLSKNVSRVYEFRHFSCLYRKCYLLSTWKMGRFLHKSNLPKGLFGIIFSFPVSSSVNPFSGFQSYTLLGYVWLSIEMSFLKNKINKKIISYSTASFLF